MSKKIALITGVTGQDGAYLSEFLLKKGYIVHGLKRHASLFNTDRIDHLYKDPHEKDVNFFLHYADLTDSTNLIRLIQQIRPDEIYNLGAQSHVKVSFETPEYTANVDALGTLRLLEAIRLLKMKNIKFYQASTSELFGKVQEIPQSEKTPFYPRSPYGVAKLYSFWITVNYRESYNMFACNGILFNHESPIRGETFVTRKITRAVTRMKFGLQKCLYLGNLNAKRDWGHAKDYVRGMWLILQQPEPEDFVLATGKTHTVREFVEKSFTKIGVIIKWKGKGIDEKGIVDDIRDKEVIGLKKGDVVVRVDPRYFRPAEVDLLVGDATKARKKLKWQPEYTLDDLIDDMIKSDTELAKKELHLKKGGLL